MNNIDPESPHFTVMGGFWTGISIKSRLPGLPDLPFKSTKKGFPGHTDLFLIKDSEVHDHGHTKIIFKKGHIGSLTHRSLLSRSLTHRTYYVKKKVPGQTDLLLFKGRHISDHRFLRDTHFLL